MAKHVLKLELDYDFLLIGISCHLKDYRLCWALNKALGINLNKANKRVEIYNKKAGQHERFTMFDYLEEESEIVYNLISNRSADGYLLPEYKEADYFLQIKEAPHTDADDVAKRIRSIDFVLTAFTVNIDRLKSKENLMFE